MENLLSEHLWGVPREKKKEKRRRKRTRRCNHISEENSKIYLERQTHTHVEWFNISTVTRQEALQVELHRTHKPFGESECFSKSGGARRQSQSCINFWKIFHIFSRILTWAAIIWKLFFLETPGKTNLEDWFFFSHRLNTQQNTRCVWDASPIRD